MKFDVFDPNLNLECPYFIEASAGTGKTFCIENFVERLLKSGKRIERILVVTFTRAATRELKQRIGAGETAKIFTIHGFCAEMLREHALILQEKTLSYADKIDVVKDFFRVGLHSYSTSQIARVTPFGEEELTKKLLRTNGEPDPTFDELVEKVLWPTSDEIWEQFEQAKECYTGFLDRSGNVKPDVLANVKRFASYVKKRDLDGLIGLGYLFMGKLKKGKIAPDPLPIATLIEEARDPKRILSSMAHTCHQMLEKVMEERETFSFDGLLHAMDRALENPAFVNSVQMAFDAAIIDEFQDTDPVQWKIFERLFAKRPDFPFVVVGDPKQSIYAFRNADIYSYLNARDVVGNRRSLSVNYRSRPNLIKALNQLFSTPHLFNDPPLPYEPVEAGRIEESLANPLQFVVGEEAEFFAFIANEILKLDLPFSSFAVLIKDRYQGKRLQTYLQNKGISAIAGRGKLIKDSPHFLPLQELHAAALDPTDRSKALAAICGKILRMEPTAKAHLRLRTLHETLTNRGFFPFFEEATRGRLPDPELVQVAALIAEHDSSFEELAMQQEDDEGALRLFPQNDGEAVSLLTTFASKGLEFDIVFALDQASPSSIEEEKMRLLYVALTRAKERAYLFIPKKGKGTSPAEYLISKIGHHDFPIIDEFSDASTRKTPSPPHISPPKPPTIPILPATLQSFSSLAHSASTEESKAPHDFSNPIKTPQTLPAGAQTGIILHEMLAGLKPSLSGFTGWEEVFQEIVDRALNLSILKGATNIMRETEFLYPTSEGMMTGVIDLLFEREGKIYLLDWKSNWLKDYSQENLHTEMEKHDYYLQAKIYREAVERLGKPVCGTYYVFLREPVIFSI